jgi:hypothetical protein
MPLAFSFARCQTLLNPTTPTSNISIVQPNLSLSITSLYYSSPPLPTLYLDCHEVPSYMLGRGHVLAFLLYAFYSEHSLLY